jgi:hypothetical protein
MMSEGWVKGTVGFSVIVGMLVFVFDGEIFWGEDLVGEV